MQKKWYIIAAAVIVVLIYLVYRNRNSNEESGFSGFINGNETRRGARILEKAGIERPLQLSEFAWQQIKKQVGRESANKLPKKRIRDAVVTLHDRDGQISLTEKQTMLQLLNKSV